MMEDMTLWIWVQAIFGAMLVGISKAGIPGVATLSVGIYALIFDPKDSVGILLPILTVANTVAILIYWKDGNWKIIIKFLPFTLIGIVIGYFTSDSIPKEKMCSTIGIMLILMTVLHFIRKWWTQKNSSEKSDQFSRNLLFTAIMGLLTGAVSLIANVGAPLTTIYLMTQKLNKIAFIGTAAWFYFIVNLFTHFLFS